MGRATLAQQQPLPPRKNMTARRSSKKRFDVSSILPETPLHIIEETTENSDDISLGSRTPRRKPVKRSKSDLIPTSSPSALLRRNDENAEPDSPTQSKSSRAGRRSISISDTSTSGSPGKKGPRKQMSPPSSPTGSDCTNKTETDDSGSSDELDNSSRRAPQRRTSEIKRSLNEYDREYEAAVPDSKHSRASAPSKSQPSDTGDELTWRLPPSESLSDWKLKVTSRDSGMTNIYHVHKSILAVGPRKCLYFVKLFKDAGKSGKQINATAFTMDDVAAKTMAQFLDYVYSGEKAVELTTETAIGLRHLSNMFGCKGLFQQVRDFVQKDLSLATMITYYKDGFALNDDKILTIAAKHCARNLMMIEKSSILLEAFEPPFFLKIMSSPGIDSTEKQYHLSRLLAAYGRLHKEFLDGNTLMQLTDEKNLPLIDKTAALVLLELEADIVVTTSITSYTSMSTLQKRCVKELSTCWRELCDTDPRRTARVCRKLPSFVVTELLIRSLWSAKASMDAGEHVKATRSPSMRSETSATSTTTTSTLSADDPSSPPSPVVPGSPRDSSSKRSQRSTRRELDLEIKHQEELSKLKKQYEDKLEAMRKLVGEKNGQITSVTAELTRFERLPNDLDGKLTACTVMNQPPKLPSIGPSHANEGQLYTKEDGNRYAVFYYKAK